MTYDARETSVYSGQPVECYKFGRAGAEFRYTDADRAVTITPGTFETTIIRRGPISQTQEIAAGSTEVTLPRNHPFVAQFAAWLPTAIVTLVIYRAHRGDSGVTVAFNGEVASSRFAGSECILMCTPLSYRFTKRIPGTTFQSKCNHALYSPLCGKNKDDFKKSGAVVAINAAEIEVAAFGTEVDQWLRNGWIERDTDNDRRFIVDHIGDTIIVDAPFIDLEVGQLVSAYAGCERTETVCATKFNNLVNHLGFARVPLRNPYDGVSEWVTGTSVSVKPSPRFRRA